MYFDNDADRPELNTNQFMHAYILYEDLVANANGLKQELEKLKKTDKYNCMTDDQKQKEEMQFKENYTEKVKREYFYFLVEEMKNSYTAKHMKRLQTSKYITFAEAFLSIHKMNPTNVPENHLSDWCKYIHRTYEDLQAKHNDLLNSSILELCMAINSGEISAFNEKAQPLTLVKIENLKNFQSIKIDAKQFVEAFGDLKRGTNKGNELNLKERATLLNLIAALYEILLETPRTYQGCVYQKADIIRKIESKYPNTQGLKSRNLHEKLKEASNFLNELNIE